MKNMKITTSPAGGGFQKGGNNHMVGWTGTGTQVPGQSAQEGSGSKRGIAPKAGGQVGFYEDHSKSGREMNASPDANKFGAGPADPGCSSASGARQDGFAKGGNTSMHSNTGSVAQQGGRSSQQ